MPLILRALAFTALLLSAPLTTSTAQGPPRGCNAPEYRQFDFWMGEWEVTNPSGNVAGHNRVESILDGCALRETWTGAKGSSGTSYNAWDSQRRRWHQTWVDNGGLVLRLEGGLVDGKMVLSGETLDSSGAVVRNRITWQETAPGTVRQLWEVSADGGKTWRVAFDGRYRRK